MIKKITLLISSLAFCTPGYSRQLSLKCETVEKFEFLPETSLEYKIIVDEEKRRVFVGGPKLAWSWYPAKITDNSIVWMYIHDYSKFKIPDSKTVTTINRITGDYVRTHQQLPDGEVKIDEQGECSFLQH